LRGLNSDRFWPVLSLVLAVVLALLAATLGGCSVTSISDFTPGKAPEVKPLEPGLYPKDYKTEVVNFLRSSLTTRVKDAFIAEPVLKTLDKIPQYITCVRYTLWDNKNQSIGNEAKLAVFLGGRLMQFLPEDPKLCAGLNYQRFPEIETMMP
jgi:hypothetical protein